MVRQDGPATCTVAIRVTDHGGLSAITSEGGFYLFEDLDPGIYLLNEIQPTGVDDGPEFLGSLEHHSIVANDTMQLTLEREDAADYIFSELGQQVASGDTAGIGFWQNKHGQSLISQGGNGRPEVLRTRHISNLL